MAYILTFQLRDSKRDFETEQARDNAYDTVKAQMIAWGIPEGNIVLTKINQETCELGHIHDNTVG